ncbi:hypothetical protein GMMP1_120026 [Candidatus Magnetomoraceae bacterium gMMP-1]
MLKQSLVVKGIMIICLVMGFILPFSFAEDIPLKISYQGNLSDASGEPVTGSKSMTFTIGSWTETQNVQIQDGLYSITLGAVTPIPANTFSGSTANLTITIDGSTLSPVTDILSVPYAYKAEKAVDTGKIAGKSVADTQPQADEVLKWNSSQSRWEPGTDSAGGSPTGSASGDLSGNYPDPTVAKLQGRSVSTSSPSSGQVLKWNGSSWAPGTDSAGGSPTGSASGDLSGNYPDPTVAKLQGRSVSTSSPSSGQVLKWNGSSWAPGTDATGSGADNDWTISGSNIYRSSGNVGIGGSPSSTLDVKGDINTTSVYKISGNTVLSTNNSNITVGTNAGREITSGSKNIFIGTQAGDENTTGSDNTFIGHCAGTENTGYNNTFIGSWAGDDNTTGGWNTFIGKDAGDDNTEGDRNVFLGGSAGKSNVSGDENVYIGYNAGLNNTTGTGNIFLGYDAGFSERGSNRLHIGYNPLIYGEFDNDKVGINTTTPRYDFDVNGTAGGNSSWSSSSDERLKKNITTIENALEKVQKMRGIEFEWKDTENYSDGKKIGFIAQEMLDVLPEVVNKTGEYYSVQYASITALLVEALKELKTENNELKAQYKADIELLKSELAELKGNKNEL